MSIKIKLTSDQKSVLQKKFPQASFVSAASLQAAAPDEWIVNGPTQDEISAALADKPHVKETVPNDVDTMLGGISQGFAGFFQILVQEVKKELEKTQADVSAKIMVASKDFQELKKGLEKTLADLNVKIGALAASVDLHNLKEQLQIKLQAEEDTRAKEIARINDIIKENDTGRKLVSNYFKEIARAMGDPADVAKIEAKK